MLIPWCEPHSAGVRCGRRGGYPALWKDNKGRKFRARTRLAEKVPHQLTPATGNLSKFPMPRFSPRFSPSCGQCGHANSTCLRRVDWRSNMFFITPELSNRHLELPSLLSSNLQHQLLTCTPTPPSSGQTSNLFITLCFLEINARRRLIGDSCFPPSLL